MKRLSFLTTLLLVLGTWVSAEATNPPKDVTIYDIQTLNGVVLGDSVRVRDVIITGIDTSPATYGFWVEEQGGGIYSGILCYTGSSFPTGLECGDVVRVKGRYTEYPAGPDTANSVSEIDSYHATDWEVLGSAPVPDPILLSCRDVGFLPTDAPRCERWEGTLVKLDTVVCVRLDPTYPTSSFFLVEAHNHPPSTSADTVYVRNNKLLQPGPPVPAVGDTLISITGLHHYESGRYQICLSDGYEPPPPPRFAPYLAIAFSTLNTSINALFDTKLDKTTAENTSNYSLNSGTPITLATLNADEQTVTLTTGAEVPGTYETLTASCIKSKGGAVMPVPQSCSFRAGICPISLVQTPKSVSNDSSQYAGDEVTVAGIVTGDYADFTTQCYIEQSGGGPWSGIQIYGGTPTTVAEGDSVIVAGYVSEYYNKTEVTSVDYIRVVSSGNPIPGPDLVDPSQINTGSATGESYEGVFVRCDQVVVVDTTGFAAFGEWDVADNVSHTVKVGHTGCYTYIPKIGHWISIRGPIDYVYDNFRIEPRRDADIDTGGCSPCAPYPPNCTVEWRDLVCGGTKAFACPSGDGSWLHVILKDEFLSPLCGVLVTATFNASCSMNLCSSVQGVTDTNGEVNLAIRGGLDVSGGPACCTVTTTVRCMSLILYSAQKDWLSPDLNGDCAVGQADNAIIVADMGSSACRSDFDCDGVVDSADIEIFVAHRTDFTDVSVGATPIHNIMHQSYPNPFNPVCTIRYDVARAGRVSLQVFDVTGSLVRTLVDGWRDAGAYNEIWDGKADDGSVLPSGVYFYSIRAGDFVAMRKMVLLH
jgi:hypothetical protein